MNIIKSLSNLYRKYVSERKNYFYYYNNSLFKYDDESVMQTQTFQSGVIYKKQRYLCLISYKDVSEMLCTSVSIIKDRLSKCNIPFIDGDCMYYGRIRDTQDEGFQKEKYYKSLYVLEELFEKSKIILNEIEGYHDK